MILSKVFPLLLILPWCNSIHGLLIPRQPRKHKNIYSRRRRSSSSSRGIITNTSLLNSASDEETKEILYKSLSALRVKELKSQCVARSIDISGVFEKEELVRLLIMDKKAGHQNNEQPSPSNNNNYDNINSSKKDTYITVLAMYSLDYDTRRTIYAENTREDVFIRPTEGILPSMTLELVGHGNRKLNLLVDTACTAVVLRPDVAKEIGLPIYNSSSTLTAAGGTNMGGGLTQLDRFRIEGYGNDTLFGPLPAAVQGIGALPSQIEGIIGLSFLQQFACVDFVFKTNKLLLHKYDNNPALLGDDDDFQFAGFCDLMPVKMQIWTAYVYLDGRGPVKMIVDTGAASTILNWKGVKAMGLSKYSDIIVKSNTPMGAMGADNVALELTHRIVITEGFSVDSNEGISLSADDSVNVEIGELPVLTALETEGIGGLLGADLLGKCGAVRFNWGAQNTLTLFR